MLSAEEQHLFRKEIMEKLRQDKPDFALGVRGKKARMAAKKTQTYVAECVGDVSKSEISDWELGRRAPSATMKLKYLIIIECLEESVK